MTFWRFKRLFNLLLVGLGRVKVIGLCVIWFLSVRYGVKLTMSKYLEGVLRSQGAFFFSALLSKRLTMSKFLDWVLGGRLKSGNKI